MNENIRRLKHRVSRTYDVLGLSEGAVRRRVIAKFAQKFGLIYFRTIDAASTEMSLVRGVTNSVGQSDSNLCVGSHDGYDMVFVEREVIVRVAGEAPVRHRWHIMEFDLHSHDNLPFLFIGTKQQSKAFYARLFALYRDVRHVDPGYLQAPKHFHPHFSVLASPAEHLFVTRVLTQEITETMAKHQYPFAIEIQDDSLFVISEATNATSVQSLTKMLHYGVWLARHIDSKQL